MRVWTWKIVWVQITSSWLLVFNSTVWKLLGFCISQFSTWLPKHVHTLISGICEFVTFSDNWGFADTINLRILRWDYPGKSAWHQCNHKGLSKQKIQIQRKLYDSGGRVWMSKWTWGASGGWKRQRNGSLSRVCRRKIALLTIWF